MTVPRVIPRRGDGLTTKRPGVLIAPAAGRPMWLPLEDAYALADELVDVAEAMEQRHAERAAQ
ncbi:hypothetical protein [Kocuria sp. WN036]|uniref:hypothetical protein n=1 Tax=Kocuria sp. WN036 TaxID=2032628 RepID=UPI001595EA74|nr:hypothetical protein [Kocuria sp. WN036]